MPSPSFYPKLVQMCNSIGMNPEDMLEVMYLESGVKTTSFHTKSKAAGLLQLMGGALRATGFTGTPEEFAKLSEDEQLEYIKRHMLNKFKQFGGPFKSAAQFYVANFWPAALSLPGVKAENPDTIIIEANPTYKKYPKVSLDFEKLAYEQNKGLDYDHDGKITYGDFQKKFESIRGDRGFMPYLRQLSMTTGEKYDVKPKNESIVDKILHKLDGYLSMFKLADNKLKIKHYSIKYREL